MRRLISTSTLLAIALVIAACSGSSGEPAPTTAASGAELDITIEGFSYTGAETAAVGDTVSITNEDTIGHTWTEVDGEFDSGTLAEGETFEFTFDEAGEFDYFCSVHPEMAGTITVEG